MTKLLLKLFVPRYADGEDPLVRSAVGTLSGSVGIAANFLLFAAKLLAGLLTGSVSITADAMNNLSDASGSVLTLVGFRLAGKPADAHHPYGHARFEYLSGLAVAAMILLIGFELAQTSLGKILHPEAITFSGAALGILLLSIAVKLWLRHFNQKLGEHIRSTALLAAAVDSRNDCLSTLAVLAAALVEHFWNLRADGVMGLGVAVFILGSGWKLARQTISPLLGEGADPELRQRIVDYVQKNPYVLGYHDLMVHDYGPGRQYASLHVEMDYREDPLICHERIDDMEYECLRSHGIHLVIHYDPVVTNDPELERMLVVVTSILRVRDARISIHDFRMVPGSGHTNLIFDVALPVQLQGQEKEIQTALEAALNELGKGVYHTVITFDLSAFN